jgi:hypothetical protein
VAAAAPAGSVITFIASLSGQTITLSSQIKLTHNVTIDASSLPGGITLNGNGSSRIFEVESDITVMLNSLTITNGKVSNSDYGGDILNRGTLMLNQCIVAGNKSDVYGGAIYNNSGMLTLNNCTLTNNSTGGFGGAISNDHGTLTINDSTLANNSVSDYGGGAIYNYSGTLTLNNSTLATISKTTERTPF